MGAVPSGAKSRRPRRGRKRTNFQHLPRPPLPVKALWTAATAEEKAAAHKGCAVMLAYWLGKIDKHTAASELGVSDLRVWQLSQQALAGMAAGLLKQPRTRRKAEALPPDPEQDPQVLRRRVLALERELKLAGDLVDLLKDLPGNKAAPNGAEGKAASASSASEPAPTPKKRLS